MTANVMLQDHHAAMQTASHSQPASTDAIWFSRFLSLKTRKNSTPGPVPASTPEHTLTSKRSAGDLSLAPTTSATQTLSSKRSFGFMPRRKSVTPSMHSKLQAVAPDVPDVPDVLDIPRRKSAAYVPRHAAADFSQVAIPTTYRDSYASMYGANTKTDSRPSTSTMTLTPPQALEPRHHASVGNVPSDKSSYSLDARNASVVRAARGPRPVDMLAETAEMAEETEVAPHVVQPQAAKSSGSDKNTPQPGSLYEKYVSDGQRQQQNRRLMPHGMPHGAVRRQSTPDIRTAAKASKFHAQFREHQQQHAPQNFIFTVAECEREASRPSTAATVGTVGTVCTQGGLQPPPSQTSPRKLRHRESSASTNTHRSGRAGSTGSIYGEHATGMSSFGRKLSEYIRPAAVSEIRRM